MVTIEEKNTVSVADWLGLMLPLLREGYGFAIYPRGLSMRPFVSGGRDHVIVHLAEGRTLRRGDIVLYRRANGTLILHRVHHVKASALYCLGDSQTMVEGPIAREDVYATATRIIRKGRVIDCESRMYRVLSGLWLRTRPLRPLLFRLWHSVRAG